MMLLTATTAWADSWTDAGGTGGSGSTDDPYYVNMPANDTKTIDLSDGSVTTFKVYDDGGKSGNYSAWTESCLVINAPEGYKINLAGSIDINSYTEFYIYEGSDASHLVTALVSGGDPNSINVTSDGNGVVFYFLSGEDVQAGWDITVTLVSNDYDITVPSASHGSIAATVGGNDAATAKEGQTVTLTATPDPGYLLADVSVTSGGEAVALTWDVWTNSATFTMPAREVTVTPTFTTKADLFVNIPKTGTRTVTIPEGVTSFKVYDDGGADGNYSANCDGTLVVNLPDGYKFALSGTVTTDAGSGDYLNVRKGVSISDSWLLYKQRSSTADEPIDIPFNYYDNFMTIKFVSDGEDCSAGLDLTVSLVSASHAVAVNNANPSGGTLTASVGGENVTAATAGQTVTLTADPAEGYVLGSLSVRDADGKVVDLINISDRTEADMLWYTGTNTATFKMPNSDVTITPVFTNVMTAEGGLTVNMPIMIKQEDGTTKSTTRFVTIPSGVTSFKVYDDGGADGNYSNNNNGKLYLTPPRAACCSCRVPSPRRAATATIWTSLTPKMRISATICCTT